MKKNDIGQFAKSFINTCNTIVYMMYIIYTVDQNNLNSKHEMS